MIEGMDKIVREHRFFAGLSEERSSWSRAAAGTSASMPANISFTRPTRRTSSI